MWLCVRSTCTFASRASANMLMPMTIAATAITPTSELQKRRISVCFPPLDDHGIQEEPKADECREEDQVAQADHTAGKVLKAVDHRDPSCDVRQYRRVA